MDGGLRVLLWALVVSVVAVGCSGEDGAARRGSDGGAEGASGATVEDELGHQAYQPSTRLVVPTAQDRVLDRAARVLAGRSEDRLGAWIFVHQRPGEGGRIAWRDVADEEPDGHQLAYVTEGILDAKGSDKGVGIDDFEMVARTDAGTAVLAVRETSRRRASRSMIRRPSASS